MLCLKFPSTFFHLAISPTVLVDLGSMSGCIEFLGLLDLCSMSFAISFLLSKNFIAVRLLPCMNTLTCPLLFCGSVHVREKRETLEKNYLLKNVLNNRELSFFSNRKNTACQLQCCHVISRQEKNGPNTPVPEVVLVFNVIMYMCRIR